MKMKKIIMVLILHVLFVFCQKKDRAPKKFNQTSPSSRFSNPNFIKDRQPKEIEKPEMPEPWKDRFKKPFNSAWMDYCDPYHCNDYHRNVCGLNRETMRFKWFQSTCHLILSNQCSVYRGFVKFDMIDAKFCHIYVMFLRQGCPTSCEDEELDPRCGLNMADGHIVLFKNQCSLDFANCKGGVVQEYEEVRMEICEEYVRRA